MKLTQKWVLIKGQTWPYENLEFKDHIGLNCEGRKEPVEREREEQRREEEEEDREAKVWNFGFLVWKLL